MVSRKYQTYVGFELLLKCLQVMVLEVLSEVSALSGGVDGPLAQHFLHLSYQLPTRHRT